MPKKTHLLHMRGIDCPPELDEKFNKWYSEVHIPLIMKTGEIEEATRYKRVSADEKYPKYLTIYRLKDKEAYARYQASPQRVVFREEMKQSWPKGGFESKWDVQYEATGTWEKGK